MAKSRIRQEEEINKAPALAEQLSNLIQAKRKTLTDVEVALTEVAKDKTSKYTDKQKEIHALALKNLSTMVADNIMRFVASDTAKWRPNGIPPITTVTDLDKFADKFIEYAKENPFVISMLDKLAFDQYGKNDVLQSFLKDASSKLVPQRSMEAPRGGTRKTRRNKTSGGDIVSHLLTIRNQIKLYHWQTKQFARHKATDDLTAALDLNIDAFVESYMGRYGRPTVKGSIKLHNFSEPAAKAFVARETKYLEKELPKKIGKGDSDLLNLRDTILGDLTKSLYLFTLQ
jgi:hypothetical protein